EGEVLGDVVISMEAAKRQANVAGHSVEKEIDILLTHGILHLAGYDHEQGLEESRRMKTLEEKIKKLLDLESKE
ncbi:MAG: rRNA maturation RNase YbeY, partial [Anaerolineales bacterium]|nr:rRNA maturation RNase YbeY [Anaerolineales bacterium]